MKNLIKHFFDRWQLGIIFISLLFAIPVITVTSFVFQGSNDVWQHLVDTVLADYVSNSLLLMLGVSVGTLSIGITTAWLTSICEFPGRKFFQWALLLPLAVPAYIIAYTYTGMLDFSGPLQTFLRELFGWGPRDYWFPEIRSLGGAMMMLSLVLYPYVYLLTRAAFLEQSSTTLEASRSLGMGPWKSFFAIALPMARPAIITGLSLALMETLADFGTVEYFGVATFTTGIFRTWFGLGDTAAASQLASTLLVFVFILILMERFSRRQAQYHQQIGRQAHARRIKLSPKQAWLASTACAIPLILGFGLPFTQLLIWTIETADEMINSDFYALVANSLSLALVTSLLALMLALFMGYGQRLKNTPFIRLMVRIASMGYAIPGTVIAIGVVIPFAWLDNTVDDWSRSQFDFSTGLIFSGTLFALVFSYLVRFLAVSVGSVESSLGKIKPSMDDAARSMGFTPFQVLKKVHIPIMRTTLLTAILLVFVDVLKELPATLLLRPFNFNTLAVHAYELAADERLADASSAAIMIVMTGIIPVILLSLAITKNQ
ncbi:ABC transporter permease [sulfur-oxidizing endosymbiont of Gigantopelta aegis]|uniref:ABC transporter permease n=1 Tax=sulfur-oxidizing endosymbiont of Gigantopelta aegis TaxID=2794934 RepID=UPI001FE998DF|nr:iron ABC transporter permease [sulfur-oxidizing endosymbiont of Gigantopelta aegis]